MYINCQLYYLIQSYFSVLQTKPNTFFNILAEEIDRNNIQVKWRKAYNLDNS